MKLLRAITNEAYVGEQWVGLTLDEIVKGGGISNPYQAFVLGWMAEYFKDGAKSKDLPLRNPGEIGATSVETVRAIKALTPEEAVTLAAYLKDCVDSGESMLHDRTMASVDWINYVLHRQR